MNMENYPLGQCIINYRKIILWLLLQNKQDPATKMRTQRPLTELEHQERKNQVSSSVCSQRYQQEEGNPRGC